METNGTAIQVVCFRDNWGTYEIFSPDGTMVAIKCSECARQEWHQKNVVSFVCQKCFNAK